MASFSQEKNLYNTIYLELKALGVKVPKPKKIRSNASKLEVFVTEKSCKIFGACLREQEWIPYGDYPIPKFVALTTEYLQKFTHKEGLFRKGGNVQRQRKLKSIIEKGGDIQDSDPNDVAALLKQWLRELPEPLIPVHLQDLFIRCHGLENEKDRETAYLFAFLLLPIDHQNTLKHLLRFFASIAEESDKNRMGTDNLALILAPNLFAWKETAGKARNNSILQHKAIIQVLIENSDRIGTIPQTYLYQSSLLGSELTASVDVLDMGPGKYKKRMSGTMQDIMSGFRRLVGHNESMKASSVSDLAEASVPRLSSKRKAQPAHSPATKRQKPSFSMDDLDNNTFVTPENKARTIPEKSSSRHSRRKSFGALFLRKREKKSHKSGTQNLEMKVVDIALDTNDSERKESNPIQTGSKCQLNLNFTHSFPVSENGHSSVAFVTCEQSTTTPVAPTRSDSISMIKKSGNLKWYVENTAESIKTSSSVESTSCGKTSKVESETSSSIESTACGKTSKVESSKASNSMECTARGKVSKVESKTTSSVESTACGKNSKVESKTSSSIESTACGKASNCEMASNHKSGLSRQEAFSIRPPRNKYQNTVFEKESKNDPKSNDLNEKAKVDTLPKGCFHTNSACNLKCSRNKSVCEKKATQSKIKKELINKRRPQSLKMPRNNEFSVNQPSHASRVNSHQNLAGNSPTSTTSSLNPTGDATAASVSQSLDLSLNLLLQNFCISPPLDAPDFRLSIDISSDKKNSEFKVNISKKETPIEKERKDSNGSNKNETSDSNPRKRLSSNSDSRIPRLKKTPNPNRPSSFHGNLATSKRRDHKIELGDKLYGRHSTKIPSLQMEGKSPSTPKERQDRNPESPNDSCFKTPNTTFAFDQSPSWMDGSHYLSALAEPDDSMTNKRESIVKILKYNPGHVLSKVNMFDSKGSSGSESDCKLIRTSSERYSSVSRCTRPVLTASNSYGGVSRNDSKNGITPHKPERPLPRRVSFKARQTPRSIRSLSKCTEENFFPEEAVDESADVE